MDGELKYSKPKKLSELYDDGRGEEAFAREVNSLVNKSYEAHSAFRQKCQNNEDYWRNQHWNDKPIDTKDEANKPRPNNPVIHSTIENCVADAMDSFPGQIIRGINYDDDMMSIIANEIVRFTLQRINYKALYEQKVRATFKKGAGVIYPFWNPELAKGTGDIDARYIPINKLAWDPNTDDINKGRWVAVEDMLAPEDVYEMYPNIDLNECFPSDQPSEPDDDSLENIRSSKKEGQVCVRTFQWQEKEPREVNRSDGKGGTVSEQVGNITYIHKAVVIGIKVPEYAKTPIEYNRFMMNMTPYVPIEGEPVSLSLIDIFKDDADIVNLIEKEIVSNMQATSHTRFLVKNEAGIDEKALLDFNKPIVRGRIINEGAVREFKPQQFSAMVVNYKSIKLAEIKEQSGQTDFNIGSGTSGVTSGVGIQRMQAYGDKRSRLQDNHFWVDHKDFVKDLLKLAQDNYDIERVIRLSRESQDQIEKKITQAMDLIAQQQQMTGTKTPEQVVALREAAMTGVMPKGVTMRGNQLVIDFSMFDLKGIDLDYDIEIIPQRKTSATSEAINNFVTQAVGNGQMPAELGMELLEMEGKEHIMKRAREYFDKDKQLKQVAQQAQEALQQVNELRQIVEKQAKINDELQDQVWNERLKVIKQMIANKNEGEGQAGGTADAEKELDDLEAKIAARRRQKSA